MTQSVQNTQNSTIPAAIACKLTGGYLIEASAGTGKTWTLTGIILRLLIEKKYAPERIIATTFTKAAAAEMQERIYERLQSFYALVRWLKNVQPKYPHWFGVESSVVPDILAELITATKAVGVDGEDLINQHLLVQILQTGADALDETIRRTALVLMTLDKLFVGTLDSLAQKWLKEFGLQTGQASERQMLTDESALIRALVHDRLRAEQSRLSVQSPSIYKQIIAHKSHAFSDVDGLSAQVKTVIDFYHAPIDEVPALDDGYDKLNNLLDEVLAINIEDFLPFLNKTYRNQIGINARSAAPNRLGSLPEILSLIRTHRLDFVAELSGHHIEALEQFTKFVDTDFFKKSGVDANAKVRFNALPWQRVAAIHELYQLLIARAQYHYDALRYRVAASVRTSLMPMLEARGETTFVMQMVRLTDALQDAALANYIRHQYPVALIDESQDINGLQALLIERVYLQGLKAQREQATRYQLVGGERPRASRDFLLLVGDPKQAIYRFRGGDVANYNWLKSYGKTQNEPPILDQSLVLDINRRSSEPLINALNRWFVDTGSTDWSNHANLGQSIRYHQIQAFNKTSKLSWKKNTDNNAHLPNKNLTIIHADAKDEIVTKMCQHINTLLADGHRLGDRVLQPSDIAILAKTHDALEAVKHELGALNIPAISARAQNVFMTDAGEDLYALLSAVLNSRSAGCVGRFLISRIVGMTLDQATALMAGEQVVLDGFGTLNKAALLAYLQQVHEKWLNDGVASALNFALSDTPFTSSGGLWLVAARLGERYLADLWQLAEIVSAQGQLHELQLLSWYEAQLNAPADEDNTQRVLPSETGVNLMTIHKSKGLEFAVVYVLELNKARSSRANDQKFYAYNRDDLTRAISVVPYKQESSSYYKELDDEEAMAELRRLGYVALTRASEQVFLVAATTASKRNIADAPLYQWLDCFDGSLTIPERMADLIDVIDLDEIALNSTQLVSTAIEETQPIAYKDWSKVMATKLFYGAKKTSFTAMIGQLDANSKAILTEMPDHDELVAMTDLHGDLLNNTPSNQTQIITPMQDDIRTRFIKGSAAGDFLHQVLERIEIGRIGNQVDELARRLSMPLKYRSDFIDNDDNEHQALVRWLNDIVHAPFGASGVSLASIAPANQVRELGFTLGLSPNFSIEKLNKVFEKYSDQPLVLKVDKADIWYRYLRGEIDLVYEYQGKFYIVDYKSNYLGAQMSDYQPASLQAAMTQAGYWLQAVIYQVALHRLLKVKLNNYTGNEAQYLGAVEYLFLRGVYADDTQCGRMVWQPPLELILAVDALFG
ncbi:UvrD-helicase domain-containing protein [Moraxella sp. FZFQ2102]|uniref:UvrD-helicase domain-containing protein n=1 Tax=Moraxella sp. FZFQ2102 TaxID=2953752 RepID=UPI00209C5BC1|nr:UvrD-helicase domain-containing protein [Moraxella sp. FZFQ2102]USZ14614.1 UvrD-helicase domain-containing protein [Moraxella sp. FZFQ2102]